MEENWAGGCPGCGGAPHTGGFWHSPGCPDNPNRIPPAPSTVELGIGKITFYPTTPDPQYGWVCPKCGAVYAPFMPNCTRCVGQDKYHSFSASNTDVEEDDES